MGEYGDSKICVVPFLQLVSSYIYYLRAIWLKGEAGNGFPSKVGVWQLLVNFNLQVYSLAAYYCFALNQCGIFNR